MTGALFLLVMILIAVASSDEVEKFATGATGGLRQHKKQNANRVKSNNPEIVDGKSQHTINSVTTKKAAASMADGSTSKCTPSFEPTCDMYSYVRFWKKKFNNVDCYQSPGRHPLGKSLEIFWDIVE